MIWPPDLPANFHRRRRALSPSISSSSGSSSDDLFLPLLCFFLYFDIQTICTAVHSPHLLKFSWTADVTSLMDRLFVPPAAGSVPNSSNSTVDASLVDNVCSFANCEVVASSSTWNILDIMFAWLCCSGFASFWICMGRWCRVCWSLFLSRAFPAIALSLFDAMTTIHVTSSWLLSPYVFCRVHP